MPRLEISLDNDTLQPKLDYLMSEAIKEDFDYPQVGPVMIKWRGSAFHIADSLWGESTDDRWISLTKDQ